MTRKFLLITYHFPPSAASGAFRMLGLARHLPRHDWQPVVVAPQAVPWEPIDEDLARQVPDSATVYHTPYPTGLLTRAARKLFGAEPVWLPRGLAAARRAFRETKPEVVITSGPPHWVHFIGLYLKRRHKIGWVADLRDPWVPRGEVGTVWIPPGLIDRHGEALMVKHADAIVANAPLALAALHHAFPHACDKITMVTNGFDPERFPTPVTADRHSLSKPVRVVHTGELYLGRDPRTFLDALQSLTREPAVGLRPIHAEFLGRNTGGKFDLDGEIKRRQLEGVVTVGGQVPYRQSLADMAGADVLLLLDGPGRKLGVPAKLYEYLGASRPILALTEPEGDSGWVLRQSGLPHRMIAPPSDAATIRQALIDLVREIDCGVQPDHAQLQKFTRAHMASQIAALMDKAVPSTAPRRSVQPPSPQEALQSVTR